MINEQEINNIVIAGIYFSNVSRIADRWRHGFLEYDRINMAIARSYFLLEKYL